MELTCTSFSFPLLSFERSLQLIALLEIPNVDLGAHGEGTHLCPARIERDPRGEADAVRQAVDRAGLGIADLFPTFGRGFRDRALNSPDAEVRRANRKRFKAFVEFCREAGCPGLTLLPGVRWDHLSLEKSLELSRRVLAEFVDEGRSRGLRVSIEPHLESVAESPERALELIESVPGLQHTLDYSHFVACGVPIDRIHPLLRFAGHIHARQAAPGCLQASHKEGTIDFEPVLRLLHVARYPGFICIEYTWQTWRHCNQQDVVSETVLLRDRLRSFIAKLESGMDPHHHSASICC